VAGVRTSSGEDRDGFRARLLELFDVAGSEHPAVAPARLALANALF
jgi:thioredoxin-like negative regulator of GroEL